MDLMNHKTTALFRAFENVVPVTLCVELGLFIFRCCVLVYLIELHFVALALLATRVANPSHAVAVTLAGKYPSHVSIIFRYRM
jgi:hypothetical protein